MQTDWQGMTQVIADSLIGKVSDKIHLGHHNCHPKRPSRACRDSVQEPRHLADEDLLLPSLDAIGEFYTRAVNCHPLYISPLTISQKESFQ